MKVRIATVGCAVALGCMACSSNTTPAEPSNAASVTRSVATAAADPSNDFCSKYAARVSQGLVDIRAAGSSNSAGAEDIATSLAAQAPVTQSDLQEVAPPEPLGYLQAMEAADAAGAAGDFSRTDDLETNLVALNDWALANCGHDYAPVFEEYRGVIG